MTIHAPLPFEERYARHLEFLARREIVALDEPLVVAHRLGLASSGLDRLLAQTNWDLTTAFRVCYLVGVTPPAPVDALAREAV